MGRRTLCGALLVVVLTLSGNVRGGLVNQWKFNEGSGTTAFDSAGSNDGTINGATWVKDPQRGWVLSFDGIDDEVDFPGYNGLTGGVPRTVCLWINTLDAGGTASNGRGLVGWGTPDPAGTRWEVVVNKMTTSNRTVDALRFNGSGNGANATGTTILTDATWHHVAVTLGTPPQGTSLTLYVDGQVETITGTALTTQTVNTGIGEVRIGNGVKTSDSPHYAGLIDDVRIYDYALTPKEIQAVMQESAGDFSASVVNPPKGATDVPREVVLSWTPGQSAKTHDVYLGTAFDDVNEANRGQPRGALVSQGQVEAAYQPPVRLAFDTTYYWRIDEVNAPPDSTIFPGDVWSFTTEPVAYPVDNQTITVTASSATNGQGPENTLNGSGLTADLHSNALTDMWLTATDTTGPAWIQYEFAQPIKPHEMWIWNHNGTLETVLGFGARAVTIESSMDGTTFQPLGTTHEFARATGQPNYTHNTVVTLGDVTVKAVKLTITSNWGGILPQYGLSEVRFFHIPVCAREPNPIPDTMSVPVEAPLTWRAGREANQHQVFLGTDPNRLSPVATVQTPSYTPALDLAATYYWRVDEVNAAETPSTWAGDIWSFSTQEYIVVDDFESYTDDMDAGEAIFQTWGDGFEIASNGSVVGNDPSPFAERTTVYSGKQSMPLAYDNTSATNSEAKRTFASPQNWSLHGVKGLTLWFYGDPANAAQQMYVRINNTKILCDGDTANLKLAQWQMWYVDLTKQSVSSVTSLSIGFDRINSVGGSGRVLIDDIRLYPLARPLVTPTDPGTTGLQAQYQFEGNANDSSGKGRNGVLQGGATFAAGKVGQALSLDGVDDYVSVTGYKGVLADANGVQHPFALSAWIKTAFTGLDIIAWGTNAAGQRMNLRVDTVLRVEFNGGNILGTYGASLLDDEWHHVAATVPQAGRMMDVRLYVDGGDVTPPNTTTVPFRLTSGVDLAIGMGGAASGRFFNGLIDEVRLYDRVLSPAEVAWLAGRTMPFDSSF